MELENSLKRLFKNEAEIVTNMNSIETWILEYERLFFKIEKPLNCISKTLPCFCYKRNLECLCVDLYYKLKSQLEIYNTNVFFQNKLYEYEKIKNSEEDKRKWLIENIEIGLDELWFFMSQNYPNIKMSFINGKQNEEFEYLRIEIDGKEFKPIYDFANLFSNLFFEEKILPNEYAKWKYENEISD